jgi:hypothetical protein
MDKIKERATENQIITLEAAYHAKIKAEILRAESRLGVQIFPITQSYFDGCTYGNLKKDFPVQYRVFHSLISRLDAKNSIITDDISENEIKFMKDVVITANRDYQSRYDSSSDIPVYSPSGSSALGLFPGERYVGERKVAMKPDVEVVGKETLGLALGKQMFFISEVYKKIESQLAEIIPHLVSYFKGQRFGDYVSTRSKMFGDILLTFANGLSLVNEIKKGDKIDSSSESIALIYVINYGQVIKPIGTRIDKTGETKHDNLKRYANPLDVLNFVKENVHLFESRSR